jgi:hypothetical protein
MAGTKPPAKKGVVGGVTGGAKSTVGGAKSAVGSTVNGVGKGVGGTVNGAGKGLGSTVGGASKGLGSTVNGASKGFGGVIGGAQKTLDNTASTTKSTASKSLPKPYSANNASSYPTEKKTAVKPGQIKPFNPPAATAPKEEKKPISPYPGTNTLPGQGGRAPVKAKPYKPMQRMAAPVERGKATFV